MGRVPEELSGKGKDGRGLACPWWSVEQHMGQLEYVNKCRKKVGKTYIC